MIVVRVRQLLIACAAALVSFTPAAHAELPQQFDSALAAYLDPLLQTNNFSGVVVVAKGDQVLFQKGYGFADVEQRVPNAPDTIFQIASVSKPFTAAAVMRLVEQGKIDLHAPLTRTLPSYPNGGKLTIHHLLTHSSGIPNINAFPEYGEIQLQPQTAADLVEAFKGKPLSFEPGSKYSYSNSNYNLLALIIEKASGSSYGEFLQREIFKPLALLKTGHRPPMSKVVLDLADGYAPEGMIGLQRGDYVDWSAKTGNGSLYSDARGLLRFVRAVHQGKLLEPASAAQTFTHHFPNIGYGWFLTEANGRHIRHANGRSPGWSAQVDHYVEEDVTVIVLSNLYVSVTTPIARAVGALYFAAPVEPMPRLTARKLPLDSIAPLLGTYQFGSDWYVPNAKVRIFSHNGEITGEYVDTDYPAFSFVPTDDGKFLVRSFWIPAEFTRDSAGRVTGLTLDEIRGVKVEQKN